MTTATAILPTIILLRLQLVLVRRLKELRWQLLRRHRHLLLVLLLAHVRVVALVDYWHGCGAHRLLLARHSQVGIARSELLLLRWCVQCRLLSWRAWLGQELNLAGKRAPANLFLDGFFVEPDAFAGPTALINVEHSTCSGYGTGLLRSCLMWRVIGVFALYKEQQK